MTRLTKRESALAWNSQAPLHMDRVVPAKRTPAKRPEAALQIACVNYLKILRNQGWLRFHVSMPEGKRDGKRAGWAKAMGLEPGWPDIMVLMYDRVYARRKCVFLELKAPGGKLSDAQEDWRAWFKRYGWEWYLITSVDQLKPIVGSAP